MKGGCSKLLLLMLLPAHLCRQRRMCPPRPCGSSHSPALNLELAAHLLLLLLLLLLGWGEAECCPVLLLFGALLLKPSNVSVPLLAAFCVFLDIFEFTATAT
jgi:hypothetical protein